VTTLRSPWFGLWRGPEALAMQASVAGGARSDPARFSDARLEGIRRAHLPTPFELALDDEARVEAAEEARRAAVLAYVATPMQAAIVAAVDTEGDAP
jgi:hypothetical protein